MKYTIHLKSNRLHPGGPCEIEAERILCNDVVLPTERHPHNVRLWVIGNEYGATAAAWASCEQDALDEATDNDLLDAFLVGEDTLKEMSEDEIERLAHLGNAGEAADLDNCWMAEAEFAAERDLALLLAFAEARGACAATLDK